MCIKYKPSCKSMQLAATLAWMHFPPPPPSVFTCGSTENFEYHQLGHFFHFPFHHWHLRLATLKTSMRHTSVMIQLCGKCLCGGVTTGYLLMPSCNFRKHPDWTRAFFLFPFLGSNSSRLQHLPREGGSGLAVLSPAARPGGKLLGWPSVLVYSPSVVRKAKTGSSKKWFFVFCSIPFVTILKWKCFSLSARFIINLCITPNSLLIPWTSPHN